MLAGSTGWAWDVNNFSLNLFEALNIDIIMSHLASADEDNFRMRSSSDCLASKQSWYAASAAVSQTARALCWVLIIV
jgi:hypothetical protein